GEAEAAERLLQRPEVVPPEGEVVEEVPPARPVARVEPGEEVGRPLGRPDHVVADRAQLRDQGFAGGEGLAVRGGAEFHGDGGTPDLVTPRATGRGRAGRPREGASGGSGLTWPSGLR